MRQTSDPAQLRGDLEAQADAAAARGDLESARDLLDRATSLDPGQAETWLKLAAICRGLGDPKRALEAVSGALRIEPLAFLPLLLKANLLEGCGKSAEAGEFYGYALAQRPAELPPHLKSMVEHAEQYHGAHVARGAERLASAEAASGARLTENEHRRLGRFRTNILRQTRPFHSEPTHFHYPGLREREFHERESFPWLEELEAATPSIIEEFERVMASEHRQLVPYVRYPQDVPLRQWAELNHNPDWTAIHLIQNGDEIAANLRHCPTTRALIERLDPPHIRRRGPNAMFSLLAPGTHIPPHTGVANTRLVCHLPLIVPDGCWFRVGAERREWQVGKAWVFDDTIEHEAANPTGSLRVILIVDTWHPDLSESERAAVAAIMTATDMAEEEAGV